MVDIAVPRDIEAEVSKIEDIYLFTIDDLQNVVNENLASRREAARDATEMLANEVSLFEQQLKTLDAVPTIRQLREEAEVVRQQTAEQARRMLATGRDPREVVDFLASTLTNRLLHGPSQRLRQAPSAAKWNCWTRPASLFDPSRNERFNSHQTGAAGRTPRRSERSAGRSRRHRGLEQVSRPVGGIFQARSGGRALPRVPGHSRRAQSRSRNGRGRRSRNARAGQ